jgi:predicted dehydrogenase
MDIYNVVIIGAGNIAALYDKPSSNMVLTHAHAVSISEKFILKGFFDTNIEKARAAAEMWNCNYFDKMEDSLNDTDVVVCAVPDDYHYDILKLISKYKIKMVLAEKPITKTLLQAKEIMKLYKKNNINIVVNYSRRFIPEFLELKKIIEKSGELLGGIGYYGKGLVHNGSHMLDLINLLVGKTDGFKVKSKSNDFFNNDPSISADLKINNSIISLTAIDCTLVTIFELELLFEKRRIRILNGGIKVEIYVVGDSIDFEGEKNYIIDKVMDIDYSTALINIYDYIDKVLKGIIKEECNIMNAYELLEICTEMRDGHEEKDFSIF